MTWELMLVLIALPLFFAIVVTALYWFGGLDHIWSRDKLATKSIKIETKRGWYDRIK